MEPYEAAEAVHLLGVKTVVPSHYGTFPLIAGTADQLRQEARDVSGLEVLDVPPGGTVAVTFSLVACDLEAARLGRRGGLQVPIGGRGSAVGAGRRRRGGDTVACQRRSTSRTASPCWATASQRRTPPHA